MSAGIQTKWMFRICVSKHRKVIVFDDFTSFLHDPIGRGPARLLDPPYKLLFELLVPDCLDGFFPLLRVKSSFIVLIEELGNHEVSAADYAIAIKIVSYIRYVLFLTVEQDLRSSLLFMAHSCFIAGLAPPIGDLHTL